MSTVYPLNLSRSLFQITTGKKHRVCGYGFVIHTEPGKPGEPGWVLALTPFSTRISLDGRSTNRCHQARFKNGFSSPLVYKLADNPEKNFAVATLDQRGAEKMVSPVPLSLALPAGRAQLTCEKIDGSFSTAYGKPEVTSSEPDQILFSPMAPRDFMGSAVVHEGKVIGMACRPFYQPGPVIVGMNGATSMLDIFDYLCRGAQGLSVHPDGHKYDLPPHIAAAIRRIAEENSCPILF